MTLNVVSAPSIGALRKVHWSVTLDARTASIIGGAGAWLVHPILGHRNLHSTGPYIPKLG